MVIAKIHEFLIRAPILDIYFQNEEESNSDHDQHESVSGNVTQSLPSGIGQSSRFDSFQT